MHVAGRAPAASRDELEEAREQFGKAMRAFGVLDVGTVNDKVLPASEKRKRIYQTAYFDKRSGGFYVCQKGHQYQKEEIEAARYLALNGYQVVMQPEGEGSRGVSLRLSKKGYKTFPEGRIGSLWYEQYTPMRGGADYVKQGLMHAHDKGASICVIYDRKLQISKVDVLRGIGKYNGQYVKQPKSVKKVFIITKLPISRRWGVYEWNR